MPRSVLLGIDSGTQSTKALAIDCDTGEIVGEGRGHHSGESTQDPRSWWNALIEATAPIAQGGFDIRGISVFSHDVFRSLDDLKAVVERDPAIQAGRLRAEYLTWFTESSAVIGPRGEVCN